MLFTNQSTLNFHHVLNLQADWWSLGCLTYALMTGRSPFATGMGTAYDNAQTLEGAPKIHWPKGVFSKEARDFISRCICVCLVDCVSRPSCDVRNCALDIIIVHSLRLQPLSLFLRIITQSLQAVHRGPHQTTGQRCRGMEAGHVASMVSALKLYS